MNDGYITLGLGAGADIGNCILLGLTSGTAPPPSIVPMEIFFFWSPGDPVDMTWSVE